MLQMDPKDQSEDCKTKNSQREEILPGASQIAYSQALNSDCKLDSDLFNEQGRGLPLISHIQILTSRASEHLRIYEAIFRSDSIRNAPYQMNLQLHSVLNQHRSSYVIGRIIYDSVITGRQHYYGKNHWLSTPP